MVDTVKELHNAVIPLSAFTTGTLGQVTLTTTNSTTQNVIKDVQAAVSGLLPAVSPALPNVLLKINGATVATVSSSVPAVSGSEIMDINSTLTINIDPADYSLARVRFGVGVPNSSATTVSAAVTDALLLTSRMGDAQFPLVQTTLTTALPNPTEIVAAGFINGDFYFAWNGGNNSSGMYRRAGGVNGVQTNVTIPGGSYMWITFDPVASKFYYVTDNGVFYVFDGTSTTTFNSTAYTSPATSTYCRAAFCNGIYWYIPNTSYGTSVLGVKASNGVKYTVNTPSGYANLSGSPGHNFTVTYDAASDTYAFTFYYAQQLFVCKLTGLPASDATVTSVAVRYSSQNPISATQYTKFYYNIPNSMLYFVDSAGNVMISVGTGIMSGAIVYTTVAALGFTNTQYLPINSFDILPFNTSTAALYPAKYNLSRVRVTAVQITP